MPIEIKKVIQLVGAFDPRYKSRTEVYAHIGKPVRDKGKEVQYAMLAIFPTNSIMRLGNINPETRMFEDISDNNSYYERASNHVIRKVLVPTGQLPCLKTLEEVLAISGISVKRELIPSE